MGFGGYRRVSKMTINRIRIKNLTLGFNRASEIAKGYRKYLEGIGNDGRVSEIHEGYRKILKKQLGFNRVSEISRGYQKY